MINKHSFANLAYELRKRERERENERQREKNKAKNKTCANIVPNIIVNYRAYTVPMNADCFPKQLLLLVV